MKKYTWILIISCLLYVGCDSDKYRREVLGNGNNIMVDQQGICWVVKHKVGDSYSVQFLSSDILLIESGNSIIIVDKNKSE